MNSKKKQKTLQFEIEDCRLKQFPPAAYVYVAGMATDTLAQTFGRIASAHAFANVLREYMEVRVVEVGAHN
jgi:hypothetical protein